MIFMALLLIRCLNRLLNRDRRPIVMVLLNLRLSSANVLRLTSLFVRLVLFCRWFIVKLRRLLGRLSLLGMISGSLRVGLRVRRVMARLLCWWLWDRLRKLLRIVAFLMLRWVGSLATMVLLVRTMEFRRMRMMLRRWHLGRGRTVFVRLRAR